MKKSYLSQCVAAITAATATSFAASALQAQEAVDPNEEVVVVAGFRSSILNSIDVKRNTDVIAEIVDAGDLGSLPDASIADALGRLPGVTTVRNSGQASQLNIRGMNGDFIQTTLNGREQATTSAETESSRWMSFDQYPAELITQAAVYKSPKASLIEGGVAATVELKTANPLEQDKDHSFNVSARLSYNDAAADVGADENGNRFTGSYLGKFFDDTLGFSIGYSHLEQPNSFVQARASADDQLGYEPITFGGTEYQFPRAYQWKAGAGTDKRDSLMSTVVWQPSDSLTVKADYFATEFEREDIRHGVVVGAASSGDFSNVVAPDGIFESYDYAISQPFGQGNSTAWIESRTEDQSSQADSSAFGLNVEWSINDAATLTVDYSTSEGEKTRKDRIATMHMYDNYTEGDAEWQEVVGQGFSFEGNGDGIPTITPNGITDLTDLSSMKLGRYEEYPHLYTDDVDSIKVDFKYELDSSIFSSIEVGYRQSERTFDSERATFLWGSRDGVFDYDEVVEEGEPPVNFSYCSDNVSEAADRPTVECSPIAIDSFATVGSVEGAPDHLIVDIDGLADEVFGAGNYDGVKLWSRNWTFIESGALTEETEAFYLMANINTEIFGLPVTGNIGVRNVKTDVKMEGVIAVAPGTGTTITDGIGETSNDYIEGKFGPEYTDTLPSLNLSFEVSENDYVRFGAAQVIGRPPVGQMKGGAGNWFGAQDLNDDGDTEDTVDGKVEANAVYNVWTKGSPALDPFRATQFDLSYEHYFEDEGMVTVAAFYKDISSLVSKQFFGPEDDSAERAEAAGYSLPETSTEWGAYETFANTKGGYIKGIEIAGTKTFTALPGIFSGLGATASYSYTDSDGGVGPGSLFPEDSDDAPLPGLSENVWSATGFWDIGSFSTHLNVRSRDEYVLNKAIPGSSTPVLAQAYTTMDWQVSYAFDIGVDVVAQVNNLTDEASKESYGVSGALGEITTYGRQFYVGVNYRF